MTNSFGRNIQQLFGRGSLWNGLGPDRPLRSVTLDDAKDFITFAFQDGGTIRYGVEGDCCSSSWIEHLEVPDDIDGQTLVEVEDVPMPTPDDVDEREYDVLQCYQTRFRTAKGDTITLEYRNDSNGYYGGYLVRVGSTDGDAE